MPPNNCDLTAALPKPVAEEHACPKCGIAMEPIEVGVEGLPLQELQLCPGCYLVMWSDEEGIHARQGVPMERNVRPHAEPALVVGEPKKC